METGKKWKVIMANITATKTVLVKASIMMVMSLLMVRDDPRLATAEETVKKINGMTAVSSKLRKISPMGFNFSMPCGINVPRMAPMDMPLKRYKAGE